MTGEALFEIWAPAESIWSPWAKPVLFAQISAQDGLPPGVDFEPRVGTWVPPLSGGAAIVIDLPGRESVTMALALAARGYRAVPLYNGCAGPMEVVNTAGIEDALVRGAAALPGLGVPPNAPPAFMLDADRMRGQSVAGPGRFDNRWLIVPQDFPSANFLLAKGIQSVLLLQRGRAQPQEDLAHVLLRWQQAGLRIQTKDPNEPGPVADIRVARPSRFRSLLHTAATLLGLRRNSAGGFGSVVPTPSESTRSGFG
jgi:hypothetical protein